jgi:HPt (histidine-containing phosphotransfer) domain-containing protein
MSETQDMPPVERADLEQSSLGDTEFERELLSEFLASSSTMLSSLAGAVASSDPTQVMQAAHSLKGCSWTVGARALGAECEQLEHEAKGGSVQLAEERLERIQGLLRQVDAYVRQNWSL